MLTLSPDAVEAIKGLTSQPGIPEGAGLKLAPGTTPEGVSIELGLVEGPEESDQIVGQQDVQVFVAQPLVSALDDKILDAGIEGDRISFTLLEQPGGDGLAT